MFKKVGASLLLIPTLLGGAALLSVNQAAQAQSYYGHYTVTPRGSNGFTIRCSGNYC